MRRPPRSIRAAAQDVEKLASPIPTTEYIERSRVAGLWSGTARPSCPVSDCQMLDLPTPRPAMAGGLVDTGLRGGRWADGERRW
jgi:hypothetical protein